MYENTLALKTFDLLKSGKKKLCDFCWTASLNFIPKYKELSRDNNIIKMMLNDGINDLSCKAPCVYYIYHLSVLLKNNYIKERILRDIIYDGTECERLNFYMRELIDKSKKFMEIE